MSAGAAQRRHVWVDSGGVQCSGLVMAWRRDPASGWQVQDPRYADLPHL